MDKLSLVIKAGMFALIAGILALVWVSWPSRITIVDSKKFVVECSELMRKEKEKPGSVTPQDWGAEIQRLKPQRVQVERNQLFIGQGLRRGYMCRWVEADKQWIVEDVGEESRKSIYAGIVEGALIPETVK